MVEYIVDIREESELESKRLISKNPEIRIINIPTSTIKKNIDFINELSRKGKVNLACRKGIRSNKIKNELFAGNDNIKSIDAIDNAPLLFKNVFLFKESKNYILPYLFLGIGFYLLFKR